MVVVAVAVAVAVPVAVGVVVVVDCRCRLHRLGFCCDFQEKECILGFKIGRQQLGVAAVGNRHGLGICGLWKDITIS